MGLSFKMIYNGKKVRYNIETFKKAEIGDNAPDHLELNTFPEISMMVLIKMLKKAH